MLAQRLIDRKAASSTYSIKAIRRRHAILYTTFLGKASFAVHRSALRSMKRPKDVVSRRLRLEMSGDYGS
ncbi:MAG: hypothetical protein DRN15_02210 [Thermoprotei archaeon]|nr:MAG: hypothetical protein DRN15_02210 [Thermoprotei archaeon]